MSQRLNLIDKDIDKKQIDDELDHLHKVMNEFSTFPKITRTSLDYIVKNTDSVILCEAGGINISLPNATNVPERKTYHVKDISGNAGSSNITIRVVGTALIDGSSTATISSNYGTTRLITDGKEWYTW